MLTQELLERVLGQGARLPNVYDRRRAGCQQPPLGAGISRRCVFNRNCKSRSGHPLLCLTIGCGSENAILYGCPHPNEPIGAMMLEAFSRILAEDAELRQALDYTFYIIKVWDVDGVRLNEPWFKGPFSITNYVRHFFRPAPTRQVDWTFPIDYKNLHFHDTIPETRALQN